MVENTQRYKAYPKYKDSGVEWLGEIPSHWNIVKGRHLGNLFGSESIPENQVSDTGVLPFIKVSTLSENGILSSLRLSLTSLAIDLASLNSSMLEIIGNIIFIFP